MELVKQYLFILRKDPKVMEHIIEETKFNIKTLVTGYAGSISSSFSLKQDLSQIITGYLIKRDLYDLFEVTLSDDDNRKVVANVRFRYERQEEK